MVVNIDFPAYYAFTNRTPHDPAQSAFRLWLWAKYTMAKLPALSAADEMKMLERDAQVMGGAYDWWFK